MMFKVTNTARSPLRLKSRRLRWPLHQMTSSLKSLNQRKRQLLLLQPQHPSLPPQPQPQHLHLRLHEEELLALFLRQLQQPVVLPLSPPLSLVGRLSSNEFRNSPLVSRRSFERRCSIHHLRKERNKKCNRTDHKDSAHLMVS